MSTVFTKIINGEIPGRFSWADERCVAFTTIAPISPGHTLVVPREPIDRFTQAPDDLLAHLSVVAKIIGAALESAFKPPRAALLVAGFEVPHLHLHVVPAWDESFLSFDNADHEASAESLDEATRTLREALRSAGHSAHVPVEMNSPAVG